MELTINHNKHFFEELPANLEVLLQSERGQNTKGIAVAINNQVIPKDDWHRTTLRNDDVILIVTASQGG